MSEVVYGAQDRLFNSIEKGPNSNLLHSGGSIYGSLEANAVDDYDPVKLAIINIEKFIDKSVHTLSLLRPEEMDADRLLNHEDQSTELGQFRKKRLKVTSARHNYGPYWKNIC